MTSINKGLKQFFFVLKLAYRKLTKAYNERTCKWCGYYILTECRERLGDLPLSILRLERF